MSIFFLFTTCCICMGCGRLVITKTYYFNTDVIEGKFYLQKCLVNKAVIKVDLIDTANNIISSTQQIAERKSGVFHLQIPSNTREGYYKLIAYMPFKENHVISSMDIPILASTQFLDTTLVRESPQVSPHFQTNQLGIKFDKSQYLTGSIANVTLENGQFLSDYSITLVDKAQVYTKNFLKQYQTQKSIDKENVVATVDKLAGYSIGYVFDQNKIACQGCEVIISMPTKKYGISYTTTNKNGAFEYPAYINSGTQNVYLHAYSHHDWTTYYTIQLENSTNTLPYFREIEGDIEQFKTQNADIINSGLMANSLHWQNKKAEEKDEELWHLNKPWENIKLYRYHDIQIIMDDYHTFETMKQTIKELVPYVNFIKKKNIRVFDVDNRRNFKNTPLFLLDGIPTHSDSLILSLDPRNIFKIEVLNTRKTLMQVGNIGQNGLIAFFTKSGVNDNIFPSIAKTKAMGIDINTKVFKENNAILHPVQYWKPFNEYSEIIQFIMPGYPASFILIVEGFDANGNYYYSHTHTSVSMSTN